MDVLGYARIILAIYCIIAAVILFIKRRHGIEIWILTYSIDVILFYGQNYFKPLNPTETLRWSAHLGIHALIIFAFYCTEKLILLKGIDIVHKLTTGTTG